MKVNYILMYGTPYLQCREFETFEDMSKFIVMRGIVDYTLFEKMEDKKEVEMIYRDNDINCLEKENRRLKDNWNKLREWIVSHKHNENTEERYLVVDYGTLLGKMQELEKGDK